MLMEGVGGTSSGEPKDRTMRPSQFICSFIASRINVALSGTAIQSSTYAELVSPPSIGILGMDRNITLVGKSLSWSDALLYCRDFHWDLLSVRGPEEQEILNELVANASFPLTSHLWVGLRRTMRPSQFICSFIELFSPSSIGILGMDRNITLVGKRLSWSDALLYCRDFHWDLLSIRGPEEQEMVDELVANASFPLTSHLWVGLRRTMRPSQLICSFIASRINVALSGTAIQSSTFVYGEAEHAIDGNMDGVYNHLSCTATSGSDKPWWRLQLPGVYRVSEIEVTNRNDGAQSRLNDVEILIGNSLVNNGNNNPRCAIIYDIPELFSPSSIGILGMDRNITLVGKRLSWSDALLYCRDFHWDLLSIRGPEEQEMVDELVANASFPLTSHLWVGLRRTMRPSQLICSFIASRINVALSGTAIQSSTFVYGEAEHAIDGNIDGVYNHRSCTATSGSDKPWWRLQLPGVYRVSEIEVTNRIDGYQSRLNDVEILIGNSLVNNGNNNPRTMRSICLICRFIVASRINVALSGTATQSSTYIYGEAEHAIDGNIDGDYFHSSCAGTDGYEKPWWRLELPDVYRVSEIEVTNRSDAYPEILNDVEILIGNSLVNNGNNNPSCSSTAGFDKPWWSLQLPSVYRVSEIEVTNMDLFSERLNDAEILIGNSPVNNGNDNPRCAIIYHTPGSWTQTIQCSGMEGRFINILNSCDVSILTLCEVKVIVEMERNVILVEKRLCWSDALLYCRDFHWDLLSLRGPEDQEDYR
ncbi:hypothetical protein CRUP_019655 [Coryphaenoides rupestris]|nr:hypothetical protein CRUP_019655 [Coryphaenoides rupestris]